REYPGAAAGTGGDRAGALLRGARRPGAARGGLPRDGDVHALHQGARGARRGARYGPRGRAMSDERREWRVVPAREGYDRWAASYDTEGNPLLALEEPEVDRALGYVAERDLLDVGCGTGRHAIRLALAGARVTAIDFSEAMLAKAPGSRVPSASASSSTTSPRRSLSPMPRSIACSARSSSSTWSIPDASSPSSR